MFDDVVSRASALGIHVVAAAGNTSGSATPPSTSARVLAIGGLDSGQPCAISARGPEVDLYAPGCGLDQASPAGEPMAAGQGTSQAAAIAGTALAVLRSYGPSESSAAAEQALVEGADRSEYAAALNLESALRHIGAGRVADAARQALAGIEAPSRLARRPRLRRPRFRLEPRVGQRQLVRLLNRPLGATASIVVRGNGWSREVRARRSWAFLPRRRARSICVRFSRGERTVSATACRRINPQ